MAYGLFYYALSFSANAKTFLVPTITTNRIRFLSVSLIVAKMNNDLVKLIQLAEATANGKRVEQSGGIVTPLL